MNAPPALLLDGRYRVGPVLARGGMSTVHRGSDVRLDRPVAIKIMDPRLAADPAFRARFEREARSAARIDHPAVVDVYDQGADGDVLFLVMELVEGGTLRDVLRARGALGVPAAFAVMEQVLSGLAAAHRLGMVHRDVKPENVLISRTGEVRVADFGLVTAAARAGASHAGMIMGTVAYLSPEQVTTGAADARSDVYAAGVLCYELLTGVPPYEGDTAISVAYRHVNSDVPPPSQIAGECPPELDDLVRRATSRDPAARPADAAALLAQLQRLATRLEVPRVRVPVPPARPVEEQDTVPAAPHRMSASPGGTKVFPHPALDPEPQPVPARRPSRRLFVVAVVLVTVLALLVGLAAWWLGVGRWTAMPAVVGLDRTAAERLLADADLTAAVTSALDDAAAAGLVTAAAPAPAASLLRGSTVTLTVSTGRPEVPRIVPGTSLAAAEQAVRDARLTPAGSTDDEFSAAVPEGAVVRTEPAAGTRLPSGGEVTLVVSKGAQPTEVEVPFLIGSSFADAEKQLEARGLKAREAESGFPFGREDGTVIDQDPGAGAQVEEGTEITLTTI